MVGFSNRQSFYASFYKLMGMTPRDYRLQHLAQHPQEKVKKPSKRAKKTKK
jgi:AraC-like DNA-binding protein